MADQTQKKPSRIQQRNRRKILDAALDVFSAHGFRGATLDQIAEQAGLSKPNILYYFDGKEEIHITLLSQLMETWLDPLIELDPQGDPLTEILAYVQRKLEMSRDLPRESRLFANEILQAVLPHDEQSHQVADILDAEPFQILTRHRVIQNTPRLLIRQPLIHIMLP